MKTNEKETTVFDKEGRLVFKKTDTGYINLSYLPNGQVETKTVVNGKIETYQKFDFMGRIVRIIKKVNDIIEIDLKYSYRIFKGILFSKCTGLYYNKNIVLNRRESIYDTY